MPQQRRTKGPRLFAQAAEMGPLPPQVLARLDALYETDFGRV